MLVVARHPNSLWMSAGSPTQTRVSHARCGYPPHTGSTPIENVSIVFATNSAREVWIPDATL